MKKATLLFLLVLVTLTSGEWTAQAGTPTLTVHPERLRFECEAGRSYTRTFTVTGQNLTEDLTLTMFGDDLTFSMNKTHISVHEAEDGVDVTVRYSPQEVGEYGANIWIESNEVRAVVQLAGEAYDGPSLSASTTELNMSCMLDEIATETFTIKGNNLEEGIHLILDDPTGAFMIDPAEIPYGNADRENTVTVYYRPTGNSCDTATILAWSHYTNDVYITLYGRPIVNRDRELVFIADVLDVDEEDGTMSPSTPSSCGLLMRGEERNGNMTLDGFGGLFNIDLDYVNHTATLYENATEMTETSTELGNRVTTVTTNRLVPNDLTNGTVSGTINDDGTISFDDFVIETEKTVTVYRPLGNQVISSETTYSYCSYNNVLLAEPNGTHTYCKNDDWDPGTVYPMLNGVTIRYSAPVYIQQRGDTIMVWNLYNMGGANQIFQDNGFFDWPWQECGYKADGGCWYNYTYYRSYQPEGEVMLNVVTYPHRLRGVKGKVTEDAMTWGKTTFGTGTVWHEDVYIDNKLTYNGNQKFECELTVWNIGNVTQLIDGLLSDDPEVITHPASDANEDGDVTIVDVTAIIDKLLLNNN